MPTAKKRLTAGGGGVANQFEAVLPGVVGFEMLKNESLEFSSISGEHQAAVLRFVAGEDQVMAQIFWIFGEPFLEPVVIQRRKFYRRRELVSAKQEVRRDGRGLDVVFHFGGEKIEERLAAKLEQMHLHHRGLAVRGMGELIGFFSVLFELPVFACFLGVGPLANEGRVEGQVLLAVEGVNGGDQAAGKND